YSSGLTGPADQLPGFQISADPLGSDRRVNPRHHSPLPQEARTIHTPPRNTQPKKELAEHVGSAIRGTSALRFQTSKELADVAIPVIADLLEGRRSEPMDHSMAVSAENGKI